VSGASGGSSAQPVSSGGSSGDSDSCYFAADAQQYADLPVWYVRHCPGQPADAATGYWGQPQPAAPAAAAPGAPAPPPLPAPAVLGAQAASKLKLPELVIHTSPEAPNMQIVGIPTWAWLAPESVAPQTATATAANGVASMTVTATAQLSRVTWDFGDGAVVTCAGPGTPYDSSYEADGHARSSPDCGHTYRRSSARQPGEAYPVSMSAQWAVSWAGGGQTGAAPAQAQAQTVTTALRVGELQAVNY